MSGARDDRERLERARCVVRGAVERKAEDVVALDVRAQSSFADTFVLATGRSDRQVRAIADSIEEAIAALGWKPLGVEGYQDGRWILMDLGDVIVHVFQPDVRGHYDLERLWSDAPVLEIEDTAARAG